jgi:ABC-type uncharacterized transport system substrate-binding protein
MSVSCVAGITGMSHNAQLALSLYSPYMTVTLQSLANTSPSPPQPLENHNSTLCFYDFNFLLDFTYREDHEVFIFLCLAHLINHVL